MELNEELALSYYRPLKTVAAQHGFQLVQHIETGAIFAERRLSTRNAGVFRTLKEHPVPGTPHICELAEDGETLIVIEEYFAGDTLSELLDERDAFPEEEAVALTLALAKIVQNLHHRIPVVIHGNIRPSNLILSPDHVLKLVGFQNAELMLPPQSETDISVTDISKTDTSGTYSGIQKDIHDIGALLNTLLTGGTFAVAGQTSSLQKLTVKELCVQEHLAVFITKCTKQDFSDHFRNIDDLVAELQAMRLCSKEKSDLPEQISGINRESRTAAQGTSSRRRFLPPGFRSGNPFNMAVATLVYALMIAFLGTEIVNQVDDSIITIGLFLTAFGIIFFTGDYLGIQSFLPITRSPRVFAKVIGIFLYDFLIFLAGLALTCVLYELASLLG